MRALLISAAVLVALGTFFPPAPVQAGCRTSSCAVEDRSISTVSVTHKVTVTVEISQENWEALLAYWRAKGKTGRCFWYASSHEGDKTNRVYGRSGTVTVYRGRKYAYNGRVHWEYFGPYN